VNIISKRDQINLTLKFLGRLSDEDLSFISDDPVLKYVKNLDKRGRKTEFDEVFQNNSKEILNILN
jgi:hypothetical protein